MKRKDAKTQRRKEACTYLCAFAPLRYLSLFFAFALFTSCGWHVADSQTTNRTISIPYAYGDSDGLLTSELVAEVQRETRLAYVRDGAEFTLQVTLLDSKSENIGFRYDPKKLESGKKKLIPDEVRRRLLAKVSVVHTLSNKVVLGPAYILGSCEFDHQYYNLSHSSNRFSLGQLTDIDTTYDVVDIPLHRDLAHQIALYLENNSDAFQ